MDRPIAIAHYPEGAGHATRMLAVAKALESAGQEVTIAGGGPGSKFIELNGYDVYRAACVDYIGDYQAGSIGKVLTRSLPKSGKRVLDIARWLRRERPAALVTDDMFAAMAAPLAGVPLFVVTHNAAALYDAVIEQSATWVLNSFQRQTARAFCYPALWERDRSDPPGIVRVPPLALDIDSGPTPDATDVIVVPSTYSVGFDRLADRLRTDGHTVTRVGGPDWEPVPALLPWIRSAEVVVCSGYSTVMEAAVAGTPCIIMPFTDEQHGVSRVIERNGIPGFQVEHSIPHIARAIRHPPEPPNHENGAAAVADTVLDRLVST